MQCYTGQLASPAIPGLSTVKLQTCPKVATRCANTESESVIDIPGLTSQTFSIKIGQCANDMICGTYTCDMAKKEQVGIMKCKVNYEINQISTPLFIILYFGRMMIQTELNYILSWIKNIIYTK